MKKTILSVVLAGLLTTPTVNVEAQMGFKAQTVLGFGGAVAAGVGTCWLFRKAKKVNDEINTLKKSPQNKETQEKIAALQKQHYLLRGLAIAAAAGSLTGFYCGTKGASVWLYVKSFVEKVFKLNAEKFKNQDSSTITKLKSNIVDQVNEFYKILDKDDAVKKSFRENELINKFSFDDVLDTERRQ